VAKCFTENWSRQQGFKGCQQACLTRQGFWCRTRPGFYQHEEPPTVPRLLPGTGPRRCPCSRPCARRRHRTLAGVSRFWRPFSDAATKREPLVSRVAGGVLHALTAAYRHPRVASDDVRTVWRNLANETKSAIHLRHVELCLERCLSRIYSRSLSSSEEKRTGILLAGREENV
jgi:hypothetical protein